ncbi:unnamed protein product [Trichobilharzia regenti]|nr:unnamed protein product [Trichobilharzia regenti]
MASLTSSDLVLRRAALSCLRQLSQKEAMDLYGYMTRSTLSSDELLPPALSTLSTLSNKDDSNNNNGDLSKTNFTNCNTKLELQLFSLLDVEMDYQLRRDIQDTLIGMLHATGTSQLTHWFSILREVLQVRPICIYLYR